MLTTKAKAIRLYWTDKDLYYILRMSDSRGHGNCSHDCMWCACQAEAQRRKLDLEAFKPTTVGIMEFLEDWGKP